MARKITWIVVGMSTLAMLVFVSAFLKTQNDLLEEQARQSMAALAQSVAYNSASALTFGDRDSAIKTLNSLKAASEVRSARIVDLKGTTFASYVAALPMTSLEDSAVVLRAPIEVGNEAVGALELTFGLSKVYAALARTALWVAPVAVAILLLVGWLSRLSALRVVRPLTHLTELANQVAQTNDYSLRVKSDRGRDEASQLAMRFNDMLDALGQREALLRESESRYRALNADLEQRVLERTADLSTSLKLLKQTQIDLVQREKMAALGSLVAGVSHELNTPIGISLTVASTLQDQSKEFSAAIANGLTRSALDRFVQDIQQGAGLLMDSLRRSVDLVASFKQVAVDQTSDNRRNYFLKQTIAENLMALGPTLRRTTHTIITEIPEEICLQSYPGPFGQVLTNLINNALIHGLKDRQQGRIFLQACATREGWVQITVHDDGAGIAAEHLSRVFEPFFTTRLGQGGSGLGLNIVHNIVTQTLGGTIHVESLAGQGARFILDIPLIAPEAAAVQTAVSQY